MFQIKLLPCCWLLLSILEFDWIDGACYSEESLFNGGRRPFPFIVHVWVSREDTGEHSCIGIRKKENRIFVPEWCVTVDGEKRGRIAIYAPKPTGRVTSFSRACPYQRYDEQFDLLYQDDDLRQIIVASDGSPGTDKPNVVILRIPGISEDPDSVACFWSDHADIFSESSNPAISMVVFWKRGPNGEFFFLQRLISDSIKQKKSFEGLREGVEDAAEAVLSVTPDDHHLVLFEGFFKSPPKMPEVEV